MGETIQDVDNDIKLKYKNNILADKYGIPKEGNVKKRSTRSKRNFI